MSKLESLAKKLDLSEFLSNLASFFAREKSIAFEGDYKVYAQLLKDLEPLTLPTPPKVKNLDTQLMHLQKNGVLHLEDIFEFGKILLFFHAVKSLSSLPKMGSFKEWVDKIQIPSNLLAMARFFEEDGEIKSGIFPELDQIRSNLSTIQSQIKSTLSSTLSQTSLAPYLVDKQIHLINGSECLLLKAGFNHFIKGMILSRSSSGFFYLCPESILKLKEKESNLKDLYQTQIYSICKELSRELSKSLLFLKFINKAFDQLDHLYARILFAREKNLEFALKQNSSEIILKDYAHPNLKNPKLLNLEFKKNLLMITGVNAGGKTMLLKSILSSVFLASYLLPQKINATHSKIGSFKHIDAIISDPQSSKDDISTFAGRMLEISSLLNTPSLLLAIDEIELGTDADEASSLYKEILEHLLSRGAKIIITTHHKRLASLMASNPSVELYAALFDEKNQIPTFSFLKGSIGKSYAFETALRYHIPHSLIQKAKEHYGEDKERLNTLIEKSTLLELELHEEKRKLQEQNKRLYKKRIELEEQISSNAQTLQKEKNRLEQIYQEALKELKKEAKSLSEIHQNMNKSSSILKKAQSPESPLAQSPREFQVGEKIRYGKSKGVIKGKSGSLYLIECDDGFKLKVKAHALKPYGNTPTPTAPKTKIIAPKNSVGISLDLHGLRAEEALERADKFISDCLLAGYDEVLIYHGIGSGILSKVIKDFLSTHPKVVSFSDAPPQMGGFGAKVVRL